MNPTPKPYPFCTLPDNLIVEENEHAVLILDGYPVSPGHSLIIPKRHVGSFFEIMDIERAALFTLLDRAKELVSDQHQPDGFNIGINDGAAAGQTVPHLHIHLIPRYYGDLADPRGGVRWVICSSGGWYLCANFWRGRSTGPLYRCVTFKL